MTGLAVKRVKVPGQLTWDAVQGMRYRVYKAEQGATPAALTETTEASYLDKDVLWNKVYEYQVATIADFVDVFTQQAVHVTGPLSATVELPALPPLSMSINEGVPGDDGIPQIVIMQSTVAVSGAYKEAVGPVDITATAGTAKVTGSSSDGSFHLVLPGDTGALWTIDISEQTVAERDVKTQLRLIKDTAPPVVSFDTSIPSSTDKDSVTLSGTAADKLTGVATLYAGSDRYDSQHFTLIQGSKGSFYGELPLDYGDNILSVHAVDGAGNAADATVTVTRKAALQPSLVVTSPLSGSSVDIDTVDISGVVYTGLPPEKVRITLGGQQQFPSSGDATQGYPFSFTGLKLSEGYNAFTVNVDTPAGSAQQTVGVTYQPPVAPTPPTPPSIDITSPTVSTTTSDTSVTVTGSVAGDGGSPVTLTANGADVPLVGQTDSNGNFQYTVDLSACTDGSNTLTLVATDAAGNQTTRTITLDCDRTAPTLTLADSSLEAAPTVNHLLDNPYRLQGTVSDAHLAGLSINGQTVTLLPGDGDSYTFSAALQLPQGSQTTATLDAWDAAGNHTTQDYVLAADAPLSIEFVSPRDGDSLQGTDPNTAVQLVARVDGLESGESVAATLDGGAPQPLGVDLNAASAQLQIPDSRGDHKIGVQVSAADGTVLSRSEISITLVNQADIPLSMTRSEPANGATGIAPNAPINLYFNKPIDPSKLQVTLKETVHGMDYDLSNQVGAGYTELPAPTLVRVDHDMQAIGGAIQTFPGNLFVSLTPSNRLAYGGQEYMEVTYDGTSLARFTFQVQALPTLIAGMVSDEQGNPVSGLTVQLPDAGLSAKTDSDGNFSFGSGAQVSTALPGGRYAIVVNPGMQNPAYGTLTRHVSVTEGRLNNVDAFRVPLLNTAIPYVRVSGGQSQVMLAGSGLQLDLSGASLSFPADGSNAGNIHVDFLIATQLAFPSTTGAAPTWLYGLQPAGVTVQGDIGEQIEMPKLLGSYAYIPPSGTLVALVGLNPDTETIEPVGVGEISGHTVQSLGSVELKRLDYLGYAIVGAQGQQVLADYRDGKIASLTALRSALIDASGQ